MRPGALACRMAMRCRPRVELSYSDSTFGLIEEPLVTEKGADHRAPPADPGVAETNQDRSRTEVRPDESAYPHARPAGRCLPRSLPRRGLPDLPDTDRRL